MSFMPSSFRCAKCGAPATRCKCEGGHLLVPPQSEYQTVNEYTGRDLRGPIRALNDKVMDAHGTLSVLYFAKYSKSRRRIIARSLHDLARELEGLANLLD